MDRKVYVSAIIGEGGIMGSFQGRSASAAR